MRLIGLTSFICFISIILRFDKIFAFLVFSDFLARCVFTLKAKSHLAKSSFFFLSFFEVFIYESTINSFDNSCILLYFFGFNSGISRLPADVIIRQVSYKDCLTSVDNLFYSMWWQEREASDMLGLFFSFKRDRRSAFITPLTELAPLRKTTPTSGFYEFRSFKDFFSSCGFERSCS